jgi:hypothetical protein
MVICLFLAVGRCPFRCMHQQYSVWPHGQAKNAHRITFFPHPSSPASRPAFHCRPSPCAHASRPSRLRCAVGVALHARGLAMPLSSFILPRSLHPSLASSGPPDRPQAAACADQGSRLTSTSAQPFRWPSRDMPRGPMPSPLPQSRGSLAACPCQNMGLSKASTRAMTFAGCAGSDKAVTAAIAFLRVSGQSFSDGSECLSHSSPRSIRSAVSSVCATVVMLFWFIVPSFLIEPRCWVGDVLRFARSEGSHLLREAEHDVVVRSDLHCFGVSLARCGLADPARVTFPELSESRHLHKIYLVHFQGYIFQGYGGYHFALGGWRILR